MKVLNSYKICLSKKTGILCGFYKFLNVLFEIAQQVKLYSDDEVAALKYKDAYGIMTFTAQYGVEQAQIFTGGTTAAQKYASVEQALKDAASGDTVKIIKAGKITPTTADGVEAAKDVTLEHYNDATRFYKTTVSSKIAVDGDSVGNPDGWKTRAF